MNRQEAIDFIQKQIIKGERATNYGTPENNFKSIADFWNLYLGIDTIKAHDVTAMMILLKLARVKNNPTHEDSWADIGGYAFCGVEVATEGKNED